MHVDLHPTMRDAPLAREAAALTSACVHCGFCLPTCPTYADARDERDSPRGRIYLIRHLLESGDAGEHTRLHLDRCLSCRNCETACPSGMQYGQLLDIGRLMIEDRAPRGRLQRWQRRGLRALFSRPALLRPILALGRAFAPLLPRPLARRIPPASRAGPVPPPTRRRKMLLLAGCVQQAATPATNGAARRVFDRLGISLVEVPAARCCGALDHHLAAHSDGLDHVRRNIDAWWPLLEQGAEAVVSSASGCGAMLADYGRLLAHDPAYASKAARVAELHRDIGEVLLAQDLERLAPDTRVGPVAVHTPCSLRNALGQPQLPREILTRAGFELLPETAPPLCCGSAGSYSLLQPAISQRLLGQTLDGLIGTAQPRLIATANVGCQLHLASGATVPVKHWIELLDTGSRATGTTPAAG